MAPSTTLSNRSKLRSFRLDFYLLGRYLHLCIDVSLFTFALLTRRYDKATLEPLEVEQTLASEERATEDAEVSQQTLIPFDRLATFPSPSYISDPLQPSSAVSSDSECIDEQDEPLFSPTLTRSTSSRSTDSDFSSFDKFGHQFPSDPPRLPRSDAYYLKMKVIDEWMVERGRYLTERDQSKVRSVAVDHVEMEEEGEWRCWCELHQQRANKYIWDSVEAMSRKRLVGILELTSKPMRLRSLESKQRIRDLTEEEIDVGFVDLPSLRRPDLRVSNGQRRRRIGGGSVIDSWFTQSRELRQRVLVNQAEQYTRPEGLWIVGDVVEEDELEEDLAEEEERFEVKTAKIVHLGDRTTLSTVLEDVEGERKDDEGSSTDVDWSKWSAEVTDEDYFSELPIF